MKLQVIITLGLIILACPLVLAAGAIYHIPHPSDMWGANPIYFGDLINENTDIRICLNRIAAAGTTFKVYPSGKVYFIGGEPNDSNYFPVPINTLLNGEEEYIIMGLKEIKLQANSPFILGIREGMRETASIWVTINGIFINPVEHIDY